MHKYRVKKYFLPAKPSSIPYISCQENIGEGWFQMTRQSFGQRLRELRKKKGLDQLALALQAGYENASAISKIEKGLVDVPLSSILALARALDIPVSTFFCEQEIETIPLPRGVLRDLYERTHHLADDLQAALSLYE